MSVSFNSIPYFDG